MKSKILFLIVLIISVPICGVNPPIVSDTSFEGHKDRVSSVLFIDKNRIVTGSFDGRVQVVDITAGKILHTIPNLGQVTSLGAVPPKILYIGSTAKNFPLFYDYNTGILIGTGLVRGAGHNAGITALTVVDANSVATGASDGTVVVLYASMAAKFFALKQPINAMATVSTTRVLATSANANGIFMIDPPANTAQYLPLPQGFTTPQSIAVLSPTRWAIGLVDGRILILDSTTGVNQMRVLQGHSGAVHALSALSAKILASCSTDETVKIWDAETTKLKATLKTGKPAGAAYSVQAEWIEAPKKARVIAGFANGTIWLWNNVDLP